MGLIPSKHPNHFVNLVKRISTGSMVEIRGPKDKTLTGVVAWPFDYQNAQRREAAIDEWQRNVGISEHLPVFLFEPIESTHASTFYHIRHLNATPENFHPHKNVMDWAWVSISKILQTTALGYLKPKDFHTWPVHLRVSVFAKCETDGVSFAPGSSGRLLLTRGPGGVRKQLIDVAWEFSHPKFRTERYPSGAKGQFYGPYNNVWTIADSGNLSLRIAGASDYVFPDRLFWGDQREERSPQFKEGEHILVRIKEGGRALARIVAKDDSCYVVQIVGRCPEALLGGQKSVSFSESIDKYEHTAVEVRQKVEVAADLLWRGQNLKGLTGIALTPVDDEDEVGVELQKKVGGGSLDGQGANGHCLFIPTKALKVI